MNAIDIYSTTGMLQVIESLRRAPNFLQTMFFPFEAMFDSEEIAFDIEEDDLRLAPFVSPLVESKAEKAKGFTTNRLKPAYVKPKNVLTPKNVTKRLAGEGVGGRARQRRKHS